MLLDCSHIVHSQVRDCHHKLHIQDYQEEQYQLAPKAWSHSFHNSVLRIYVFINIYCITDDEILCLNHTGVVSCEYVLEENKMMSAKHCSNELWLAILWKIATMKFNGLALRPSSPRLLPLQKINNGVLAASWYVVIPAPPRLYYYMMLIACSNKLSLISVSKLLFIFIFISCELLRSGYWMYNKFASKIYKSKGLAWYRNHYF